MTQQPESLFPDPHADDSAEDPLLGPSDEGLEDGPLGASPADPLDNARTPRMRTALIFVGAFLVVSSAWLFLSSGDDSSGDLATVVSDTAAVEVATASQPTAPQGSDSFSASPEGSPSMPYRPEDAGRAGTFNMEDYPESQPGQASPATPPTDLADLIGGAPGTAQPGPGTIDGLVDPRQANAINQSAVAGADPYATTPQRDTVSIERMRAEILAELTAGRNAIAEREEELRSQGTLMAEAGSFDMVPSRMAGPGRATPSNGAIQAPDGGPLAVQGAFARASYNSVQQNLLPGVRATARLVSSFIADQDGAGTVETVLTSPLRSRDETLLPAGTRGYGRATASGGMGPGDPARVSITFSVWVTPTGEVIRDLEGQAADPETLAMSVPGDVDHRRGQQILRGIAATALDLAIASAASDRASVFEQPSARDLAINDARTRATRIVGDDLGDERSARPTVTLERDTEILIIFGIR